MSVAVSSLPSTSRARHIPAPNATLVGRYDVTATLATFVLELDRPITAFRPGQYVALGLTYATALIQRPYSIVSLDQSGKRVELFIRRLPNGRFSNLLWTTERGARAFVGPVKGLFTLDLGDPRPRLMVGTGTGVAPLLAMLEGLSVAHDTTPAVLIHGASFHAELAYARRVRRWIADGLPVDYRPTVSRPHEARNFGWTGLLGRAETQLERLLLESPAMASGGAVGYLCGNADMIEAASTVLRSFGFRAADIRAEQFHAAAVQTPM